MVALEGGGPGQADLCADVLVCVVWVVCVGIVIVIVDVVVVVVEWL